MNTAAQVAAVVRFGYTGKNLLAVQTELQDKFGIHSDWNQIKLPDEVHQQVLDICPSQLIDGRYSDPDSALIVCIAENSRTGQIMLANPGTTAGAYKGGSLMRSFFNLRANINQWSGTNIQSLQGHVPNSYKKTAILAAFLKNWCGKEGKELILAGHSKGAGEAGYASLTHDLKAFCFCSPPLGIGVLAKFSTEKLLASLKNIKHIFIDGDPVSSNFLMEPTYMSWLIKTAMSIGPVAYVGEAHALPASAKVFGTNWPVGIYIHENFHANVAAAAEAARTGEATPAAEVTQFREEQKYTT